LPLESKEIDMSSHDCDALVAGAGPVGLTLASELRRHGATPRIVDKAAGPKNISKAMILHVRTQEVFDAMGTLTAAKSRSVPLRSVELVAYGKYIGQWNLEGIDTPVVHPVILGQDRTERLLGERLVELGGRVDWNVEATSFTQNAEGVETTLKHADGREEKVRSRYIVGCEGSNSMVRKSLGLSFEGERYEGEQFIQADCKIRWSMPKGRSYLFLTGHGYMMVIEMPDDRVRVFISLPDNAAKAAHDPDEVVVEDLNAVPPLREVETALNQLSGLDATLSDDTWRARYRTSHRYADRFRVGRAFVAGDAAHIHVPLGGQGMNTGIQDAFNLGWKLAYALRGTAKPSILETYQEERHPVAEALIHGTDRAYKFVLHANDMLRSAVGFLGPFAIKLDAVQTKFRNTLEEVEIAYPKSALTKEAARASGPTAGQRVIDAPIVSMPSMETVRLWDLLKGAHWTLLLLPGTSPSADTFRSLMLAADAVTSRGLGESVRVQVVAVEPPPSNALRAEVSLHLDRTMQLHRRYGDGASGIYLLRPDRYVGFRGRAEDTRALGDYLDGVFVGRNGK
jgi:3-(3-hydroxy-phenyl)propionate hydroxylase